ncbi:MAG: hypothetical protein C4335_09380 [Armatimonadota bacterium]
MEHQDQVNELLESETNSIRSESACTRTLPIWCGKQGDYANILPIDDEQMEQLVEQSHEFIARIEDYLSEISIY